LLREVEKDLFESSQKTEMEIERKKIFDKSFHSSDLATSEEDEETEQTQKKKVNPSQKIIK